MFIKFLEKTLPKYFLRYKKDKGVTFSGGAAPL